MNKLLQKLMFWRQGDKPESPSAVSEQCPNHRYRDSQGNPTAAVLEEQRAARLRREALERESRKIDETDDSPRPDYDP